MKIQSGKSTVRTSNRSRLGRLRQLRMESLENRLLMARDVNMFHNDLIAEDVNRDFRVTAMDALAVISMLNKRYRGAAADTSSSMKWDVNADGRLTPLDALGVISRLNGEGEGGPLLGFTYDVINPATGAILTETQKQNIPVGSEFQVNISAQDLRMAADLEIFDNPDDEVPPRPWAGIFTANLDLGMSGLEFAEYIPSTTGTTINARFRNGVRALGDFFSAPRAFEGGGINLGNGDLPQIIDGASFTVTTSSGTVTFELDSNSSLVNSANTRVALPGTGTIDHPTAGDAIAAAINGSSLGISTARYAGNTTVVLPSNATFDPLQSGLLPSSQAQEFFDEIGATQDFPSSGEPPLDPLSVKGFVSIKFRAKAPGTVTFRPNAFEDTLSTNSLITPEGGIELVDSMVSYGNPFNITVISDPFGPRVTNDTLTTDEDVNLNINRATLLSNDTSGATPARALTVSSIQTIASTLGTLVGDVYTPPANVNGNAADFLTYTVRDSSGLTATGTITINLTPVNDQPDAVNDNLTAVFASTDNDYNVLDNDTKGPANESSQTLTIIAVGTPSAGGTVTIAAGGQRLIYTPNSSFVGQETFTYTIQDNGNPARTDTATVTVDVQPATRPFAARDRFTVLEDSLATNVDNRLNVLQNDLANVGQTAILVGVVAAPTNGTAVLDAGRIVYTPNANFFGTDTFTYSMNESNGSGANSIGSVTVTVTNVNDVPVPANDTGADLVAEENVVTNFPVTRLVANDSKGPGETDQTLTIVRNSVTAITVGGGTVALAADGTNVVYSPVSGFSGTFLFTYQVTDNGTPPLTSTAPATVTVTVTPFNDPPVLQNDTASGTEDSNVTIALSTLLGNDSPGPGETSGADTQTLSVTSVAAVTAGAGSVAIVGTNVVYTPTSNFNGPFVFTYTATDTGNPAKSATATVTVNMAAVNDAPVVGADTVRAFKNNALRIPFAQLLANDNAGAANESFQVLSISSVQSPVNGTVQIDTARSEVVFTPTAEFIGSASFQYTVRDNGGGTDTTSGNVSVTVEEFQPSSIGGTVWIDETKDNIIGQVINGNVVKNERYLGGVQVVLTGSSLGQAIAPQTAVTLSDGTYRFEDLGPGSYQISFDPSIYAGVASSFYTTNVTTVNIPEPGGIDATRNYAVSGIDSASVVKLGKLMDQLVSQYHADSSIGLRGAFFAIAKDNSLMWGLKLAGFTDAIYTEAVLDGTDLLVTVVDANRRLRTARVSHQFFSFIKDSNGDMLVRLIGSMGEFTWVDTSLATPAFTAQNYLASVDALFDQRGW